MYVRPVTTPRYFQTLIKMGIKHGRQFDCGDVQCPICLPYREKEREEYNLLDDKEKLDSIISGKFVLNPIVKSRANSRASNKGRTRGKSGLSDDKSWLTWDK